MKESDITPNVIRLSKKIAKHWRMEAYKGCWVIDFTLYGRTQEYLSLVTYKAEDTTDLIPIPSISDCLEKLRELGWHLYQGRGGDDYYALDFKTWEERNGQMWITLQSSALSAVEKTLHLALLSALLEVLRREA